MTRTPPLEARVDPRRSALIVVDMQNDFVHPDGETARWMRARLESAGGSVPDGPTLTEKMVPALRHLVDEARAAAVPVIWVRMELDGSTRDRFMTSEGWLPCEAGSWGAGWYADLGPAEGEVTIVKRRHSAFFGTDLAERLRAWDVDSVIVTGTATMGCVEGTVRDAYAHDFWAVVVTDATGQMDAEAHQIAIQRIDRVFGMAATSDEILRAWDRVAAPSSTPNES